VCFCHFVPVLFTSVVLDLVSSVPVLTKPINWIERTSPKWPMLYRAGRKTLTQSQSQYRYEVFHRKLECWQLMSQSDGRPTVCSHDNFGGFRRNSGER